jgi:hypothetical protein
MEQILSIKPDLILVWPKHLDFPYWRQQLHNNRRYFSKVIIVFTNMNTGNDYRDFIHYAMASDDVTFLDNEEVTGDQDWRNVAVNLALKHSDNEWVFFTEQDFFYEKDLLEYVQNSRTVDSCIGVLVGLRLHPCCIFIKRKLLDSTSLNFSVIKDVSDHFSRIQNDLDEKELIRVIPHTMWTHLGGLSQNMHILMNGGKIEYMPKEFAEYVRLCLNVTVPMHLDFIDLFRFNEQNQRTINE